MAAFRVTLSWSSTNFK